VAEAVHQAVKVAMTVAVMVAAAAKVVGAVATVVDATAAALTEAVAMVEALRVASMEEREVVVRAARASVAMAPAMVAEEADEPGAAVLVMEAAKGHTPPEVGYPPQKGSCDHRDKADECPVHCLPHQKARYFCWSGQQCQFQS